MNRNLGVTQGHTNIDEEVDNCIYGMQRRIQKPLARASTIEIDFGHTSMQ